MAPPCFFVLDTRPDSSPARSLSASHKLREPSSNAPAIMPLFEFVPKFVHARSWKLHNDFSHLGNLIAGRAAYPASVAVLPEGLNSLDCPLPSNPKSHNSRHVSLLKSISTAPAFVPVASKGNAAPGDQANAAVRGISRKRTMIYVENNKLRKQILVALAGHRGM